MFLIEAISLSIYLKVNSTVILKMCLCLYLVKSAIYFYLFIVYLQVSRMKEVVMETLQQVMKL